MSIDHQRNEQKNDVSVQHVRSADSNGKVVVIPTNEEMVIARETKELLEK